MKRIGILGGTFDPPHLGHLIIANEVLNTFQLNEVWFMPNQEPPHKRMSSETKVEDRVNLLKRAINGHPNFKLELIELEREGPSYTYETMKILTEKHPNHQFYFIIGADMVENLPKWRNIEELIKLVQFIGVNRPSYCHESKFPILYAEVPDIAISSSQIRNRMKESKTIRYLVPDAVRKYIKEQQLYGS